MLFFSNSLDGTQNNFSAQVEKWEMSHLGNFRLIYPNDNIDMYEEFFSQNQCSIFQETFASRAREEAQRVQREEFEVCLSDCIKTRGLFL